MILFSKDFRVSGFDTEVSLSVLEKNKPKGKHIGACREKKMSAVVSGKQPLEDKGEMFLYYNC